MNRLTEAVRLRLDVFNRCQLCGHVGDICEFRMWQECDEQDQPEPYNVLVACKQDQCQGRIDQHERLYRVVPWGQGQPGHLMLLCGDCDFRAGTRCFHPRLAINCGDGLLLYRAAWPWHVVCSHDDTKPDGGHSCNFDCFPTPFNECTGFNPRPE